MKHFLAWTVTIVVKRINNVNSAAGDLETFSKMKTHFKTQYQLETELFTKDSRPEQLKRLYEQARDKHQPTVSPVDGDLH